MYAVIKTGGKQYKVIAGQKLKVDLISLDINSEIVLDKILAIEKNDGSLEIGAPFIQNASVLGTIVSHGRHKKIRIFKMNKRKHYKKSQGHRQNFTEILIKDIYFN